ncbi:HAMP domain-containing protein [Sphingopyxis flava]|uniref:HAMP domain-containing protein n=1 Tax=Sphingopyxis flava TaxID=1507287 RepID=A0A1T5BHY2_9SPHN|nr:HAMP domain-containing protein [Sphingopyxis flava]SKB46901.1 HAMP domain-containing protein [Sphingopyxis flava]
MPRRGIALKALLLRSFLPSVVVVAILLAAFVYQRVYATIIDGFDRKLVTVAALTGAMIDPADHDRLMSAARAGEDADRIEMSARYRRNNDPIRRIQQQLNLTYLYTQVLGGTSDIYYVLDGTQGEEHSPPGSTDEVTDETRAGLRQLQEAGAIYVSPIEYQEQWGLLKTAAAPVLGEDGRIAASAGADVNISVIQVATQNALFMSAMIGVASIIACLLVAMRLVRRIADPMEALTGNMLQIAGGRAHSVARVFGPREVERLAGALTALVRRTEAEERRRDADLDARETAARAALLAGEELVPVNLLIAEGERILWVPHFPADPETVLAHRAMTHHARRFASDPALAADWRSLADMRQGDCLVVDGAAGRVALLGTRAVTILVAEQRLPLAPEMALGFDPADPVALMRPDGSAFLLWVGNER